MNKNFLRLIGLIVLIFIIWGVYEYAHKVTAPTASTASSIHLTYYCDSNATINALYDNENNTVSLTLSDGRIFDLPHAVSGSGARYEATSTGADIVFWSKGNNAFLTEDDATTYNNCTAGKVTDSDAPGYKTYTDQSDLFRFAFPSTFEIAGSAVGYTLDWSALGTTTGMVLAKINVPQSFEPNTNFGDAKFTVGVSADPSAVATCLDPITGPTASTSQATIGGFNFAKLTRTDAGAGNRYETTSYRVIRDNQCYAIEYTIHYSVLENYPKDTVKAFDRAKIVGALEEVAKSFQFLPLQ